MTRSHITLCTLLFFTLVSCSTYVHQVDSPTMSAKLFAKNEVKVTQGLFWQAEQRDARFLLSLNPDRFLSGFLQEAGLKPKAPKYGAWESEGVAGQTPGHYLSACAQYYGTTGDMRFLHIVNYMVEQLDSCQQANGNGYLAATPNGKQIFAEVAAGNISSKPFDLNGGWVPIYVMHKVLAGLIDAYQYAGSTRALKVAERLGHWMYQTFNHLTEPQMQQVLACEFGGMNEALANLYALTKEQHFLGLARRFDNHQTIMDPLAAQKDSLEGKHANTQIPKIVGAARMYEVTGSRRDSTIADFFWHTVTGFHTYANGGNSDGEHFGAPGKLSNRLSGSTTETCNTYNMLKLTTHLFCWNTRQEYIAYYERALYNQILGSQNPDDGMCLYYTPLCTGGKKNYLSPDAFVCCSGTGMENHIKYADFIYAQGEDNSLFVNLFIPSRLDWKEREMVVTQDSDIPVGNSTALTFSTPNPQRLVVRLRWPEWASEMKLKLNGHAVKAQCKPGAYVSLDRRWKTGDRLEVEFKMNIYTVPMPDNPKRVAIFYGPTLLAGELGKEKPDFQKGSPMLACEGLPTDQWLERVPDTLLRFRTKSIGRPHDYSLIPFYQMHHQHYVVYWDLTPQLSTFNSQPLDHYLMVYHEDRDHSLHMALSEDGYQFHTINKGEAVLSGDTIARERGIRDPHIYRAPNGTFLLAMTDLHCRAKELGLRSTTWERDEKIYDWGNNRGLVLARSTDLIHWTHTKVSFDHFPGFADVACVWAPETIYDEATHQIMLYFTLRHTGGRTQLYYSYVNDTFDTILTPPRLLFQYPDNHTQVLDADIMPFNGKYYMTYCCQDPISGVKVAVSDKICGPYEYRDGQVDGESSSCEAPNVWKREGTDKYVLMYDLFGMEGGSFGFAETTDFVHFTPIGRFNNGGPMSADFKRPKHGAVIPITEQEAQRLRQFWDKE